MHSLTHAFFTMCNCQGWKEDKKTQLGLGPLACGCWEERMPLASHFPWSTGGPSPHSHWPFYPAWLTGLLCIHHSRETLKRRRGEGGYNIWEPSTQKSFRSWDSSLRPPPPLLSSSDTTFPLHLSPSLTPLLFLSYSPLLFFSSPSPGCPSFPCLFSTGPNPNRLSNCFKNILPFPSPPLPLISVLCSSQRTDTLFYSGGGAGVSLAWVSRLLLHRTISGGMSKPDPKALWQIPI